MENITSVTKEDVTKYFNEEITLNEIKEGILKKRSLRVGLTNGKPFECLDTSDVDWLKFATKELDLYRWNNVTCAHCGKTLSTDHIIICEGTKRIRDEIREMVGGCAETVLKDPSTLNKMDTKARKVTKSFIAKRISNMILSAEGRTAI